MGGHSKMGGRDDGAPRRLGEVLHRAPPAVSARAARPAVGAVDAERIAKLGKAEESGPRKCQQSAN